LIKEYLFQKDWTFLIMITTFLKKNNYKYYSFYHGTSFINRYWREKLSIMD